MAHIPGANLVKLRSELSEAIEDQKQYELVDETKKRAIKTAENYEVFKNVVAACGLNPIERNEFTAPPKNHKANSLFVTNTSKQQSNSLLKYIR